MDTEAGSAAAPGMSGSLRVLPATTPVTRISIALPGRTADTPGASWRFNLRLAAAKAPATTIRGRKGRAVHSTATTCSR